MKTIVDQIRMNSYKGNAGIHCFVRKKLKALLGDEILFNPKTMEIRRPTIDNKKTLHIKNKYFAFYPENIEYEDYVGLYNVIQKDEDTFKLKKVKNHA